MSALRPLAATIVTLALLAGTAISQEAPRPPQPPLTNATLEDWSRELTAIHELRDNAFLFDDAASDFGRRLAAWSKANVTLNLEVLRVTKEAVLCDSQKMPGHITIRNQHEPVNPPQQFEDRAIAVRIGDVIPLEVARGLRAGDRLVVRGAVAASGYQPGRASPELVIGQAQAAAVVSKTYARNVRDFDPAVQVFAERMNRERLIQTPAYPASALAAGAGGQAVVTIDGEEFTLSQSAGHPLLDEAVMESMRQVGNRNTRFFPGEHRFTFTIIRP